MGIEINMDGSFFYDKPNPINFFKIYTTWA